MQPTTFEASAGYSPSPLMTPATAEQMRAELGRALENYLAPVADYCDRQEANEELSTAGFQHVFSLREVIAALLRYDEQTEQLLAHYRQALAYAQQQHIQQVPTLEHALLCQLSPADLLAHREADPVYRLGYARGYHKAQQQYERITSLYAEHAILPTPAGYEPSPLVARVNAHLASPSMQAYAALPLETRRALNSLTPADLHALVSAPQSQLHGPQ